MEAEISSQMLFGGVLPAEDSGSIAAVSPELSREYDRCRD
jgi:hypothetical protein